MPYLVCPGCGVSLYSAASHSWKSDACAVCGDSLSGAAKGLQPELGARTVRREFAATPASVGAARHSLDGLYGDLGAELHASAVLLVSELVTNSVEHSEAHDSVIDLVVCATDSVVRVEVSDDGGGFRTPPIGDGRSDCGRGLELVQELADSWGHRAGHRSSVWFEINRSASVEVAPPRPTVGVRPVSATT